VFFFDKSEDMTRRCDEVDVALTTTSAEFLGVPGRDPVGSGKCFLLSFEKREFEEN
jgi:hypothetical protein